MPIYKDIKEFRYEKERDGKIDIITAGYPCQSFSLSGLRRGEEDDRFIWPDVLAVIRDARPSWAILENVGGHLSNGIRTVLSNLEEEGYSARVFLIPALAVDAKHQRDRVWIIASYDGKGAQADDNYYKLVSSDETGLLFYTPCRMTGGSNAKRLMAGHHTRPSGAKIQVRLEEQVQLLENNAVDRLNPDWVEWLMGYPTGYTDKRVDGDIFVSPTKFRKPWPREPEGIPRLVESQAELRKIRCNLLGNAIVPQIAARFFWIIADIEADIEREQSNG